VPAVTNLLVSLLPHACNASKASRARRARHRVCGVAAASTAPPSVSCCWGVVDIDNDVRVVFAVVDIIVDDPVVGR
jgi:hypothetical protein